MASGSAAQQRRVRTLLTEQRALVSTLLEQREQMQGSLFTRFGVCGKPGCACAEGKGHGPYYVLSTRRAGQGEYTYLARREAAVARKRVSSYRRFRGGLRRLRVLNERLMAALKRYQGLVTQKGPRRARSADRIRGER
jgi:hypothetical protein